MPQGPFPPTLSHPSAGHSTLDATRLAVRWRAGDDDAARTALIESAGLQPAGADAERPAQAVNRTAGLWWVTAPDAVSEDALARLRESDLVEWVSPAYRAGGEGDEGHVFTVNPTRLLVPEATLAAIELPAGVTHDAARATSLPGLVALRIEPPATAQAVAATLPGARFESIPYLSPTACCQPPAGVFTPDDPLFGQQWGLQRIQAPRAWQLAKGSPDVTVAVLDEGVELLHPDLELHPDSWNASTDTPDGSPTGNHGTACAGIVAARLDNGQGVAGTAGGARVMAIATATWADVDIAEGLHFAADHGARVVSMSFGLYGGWDFALIGDALQYAQDRGLVLVAAAGNEDLNVCRFPGSDPRTLTVGGSNRDDERKRVGDSSSEPGWGACYGASLDVVAPCLEIPTTDRLGAAGYTAGDYDLRFNGTSSATPCVAGLAALLLSERPELTHAEVRTIIESTCDKVSPQLYAYADVAAKPSGTWNDEVGYGRVNAERALLAACAGKRDEGECSGCGGRCAEGTPEECRGPRPLPWLDPHRCMFFYEGRIFPLGQGDNKRAQVLVRVIYEHCLQLLGRHQGGLLYTTTLLPGEQQDLYEFDRYRRVRSDQERVSVHSSFRQSMSALSESRSAASSTAYLDTLTNVRVQNDTSVSAGGGLAGFLGAPSVANQTSVSVGTTVATGASTRSASEQFNQNAVTAAQATDAERALVISRFEESEHQETTRRTLRNDNECYAVTYYVRRVNEVYASTTRVASVEWQQGDGPVRALDDLAGVPGEIAKLLKTAAEQLPRPGESVQSTREVTLPTDGTLYEAELAHCSSCEPTREEATRIQLEQLRLRARRTCLENELLTLELERRRAHPDIALELGTWTIEAGDTVGSGEPADR